MYGKNVKKIVKLTNMHKKVGQCKKGSCIQISSRIQKQKFMEQKKKAQIFLKKVHNNENDHEFEKSSQI